MRLCQLKCTVAGMKMKKMVVGAGNAANGEEIGTNRAVINGAATQLELRSNDGYIHRMFVRTGDVLHGSWVQFDIIMYVNRFHGLKVSARSSVVASRDDIRVKRTRFADSVD